MSGSQYIALSGLRAHVDALDRLAADIANVGTAGYKGVRDARAAAHRDVFDAALQTAIDTTSGGTRLDMTAGALASTGRPLDLALDSPGFFVVETPAGMRYTRNGHFTLNADRQLVTEDGARVQGEAGPITFGDGDVRIDQDGTIWTGTTKAGRIKVVDFPDPQQLVPEQGARLNAGAQTPTAIDHAVVRGGTLEQSNVTVADRLAQLTTVSRGFEAMQKAISLLLNDVDGRAIDHLGRR
ncbi:MAG TPA: flagellar hook basal-body protein [Vicinamibacterales bacterium]|jgi:flagellar basal body rod protein FlgG|nr:flagellar hook basal-body protein [Vicinamibacterales bacterium]